MVRSFMFGVFFVLNLIYNQLNVYKHLEDIIEVLLLLFYSLTYLRFGVSELDFWRFGVVNGLVRGVSVPRHFLNDKKHHIYNQYNV